VLKPALKLSQSTVTTLYYIELCSFDMQHVLEFHVNMLNVSHSCICKFLKRWKCRQNMDNLHRTGRPPISDDRGNRRIIRRVKGHRKQTLAEITNCVNDVLPQPLSSRFTYSKTPFAFLWICQTENLEANCCKHGE